MKNAAVQGKDEGMILPLILVFVLVAMSLVIVVVDVTAVHIQRNQLYALADAAALDAANALDSSAFYRQNGVVPARGNLPIPLSDASVRSNVRDYLLAAAAAATVPGLAMSDPTGAPGASTAEVTLTARARLPILGSVVAAWSGGVPLTVTVQAQARDLV